jgi:hypothetical protein
MVGDNSVDLGDELGGCECACRFSPVRIKLPSCIILDDLVIVMVVAPSPPSSAACAGGIPPKDWARLPRKEVDPRSGSREDRPALGDTWVQHERHEPSQEPEAPRSDEVRPRTCACSALSQIKRPDQQGASSWGALLAMPAIFQGLEGGLMAGFQGH